MRSKLASTVTIAAALFTSDIVHSQTPGGSNTDVQYNSSGSFGGNNNFTFDGSTVTINNALRALTFSSTHATISPMDFGCVGNGVTDDTTCFQNALTASIGNQLVLGNHIYLVKSALTASGAVHISGTMAGWPSSKQSGLRAGVANLSLLSLPSGSVAENFYIDMSDSGTISNSSGSAISLGASATSVVINNIWVDSPCVGVSMNGNTNYLLNSYIGNVAGASCGGVEVGYLTTNAATVDQVVINTTVQGNVTTRSGFGLSIKDAGGMALYNDDFLYTTVGTQIVPGANQQVIWLSATSSALGDSTPAQGLVINPSSSTGLVRGLQFVGDWTATNASQDSVAINNTASGTVSDIYFVGHRAYASHGSGFSVNGASNVSIDNTHICGVDGYGVWIAPSVGNVQIRGTEIANTCAGQSGFADIAAIALAGSNSNVVITGNDLGGNTALIAGSPIGESVVKGNGTLDSYAPSIASASTITLNNAAPTYDITGSTSVSTISGAWNGREVRLISTSGPISFLTTGNICNALTSVINVQVEGWYGGSCWHLK